jgi:hypothetical protein
MNAPRLTRVMVAVFLTAMLGNAAPALARILKTRRPAEYRELALTLGSGFEYETDSEESELGIPFFAEYGLTKELKLGVEPGFVLLRRKQGGATGGMGDLETTLTCELSTERRYRPGLAFEGVVKWPTARRGELGTGETDYSLGVILSKELPRLDLEVNGIYTFIGRPTGVPLQNTFEISAAAEWHLTFDLDLEGEVVTSAGAGGGFHRPPGGLGGFGNIGGPEQGQSETEETLGLAKMITRRFKLEAGLVLKSGGSFQTVAGWEYDFGEGR